MSPQKKKKKKQIDSTAHPSRYLLDWFTWSTRKAQVPPSVGYGFECFSNTNGVSSSERGYIATNRDPHCDRVARLLLFAHADGHFLFIDLTSIARPALSVLF